MQIKRFKKLNYLVTLNKWKINKNCLYFYEFDDGWYV